MSDLLVHVGLHRTGSTWLQKAALPCPDVPIDDVWSDRADLARKIITPTDADFSCEVVRMELESRCAGIRSEEIRPAISHERLSGNPSSGGFDMSRTAERIERIAPSARILIVLREQQSALESIWCQAVRIGLYCSARDYLRMYDPGDQRIPHFEPSYLQYDRVVEEYARRFGRERVLAIDFEVLRRDPLLYMNEICRFTGAGTVTNVPKEARYARPHPLEAAILRRGNLLHRRSSMNPGPPFESKWTWRQWSNASGFLSRHAPAWLKERFQNDLAETVAGLLDTHDEMIRASNRRLRDEFEVDLKSDDWRV
ncbi:MAG: sulfotransferase [Phycisphaerales bacterium]|nr:sulfotransferase [Phycisphaerales bacterium]